jgi:Fuc2NAc and GlcNAc transferase
MFTLEVSAIAFGWILSYSILTLMLPFLVTLLPDRPNFRSSHTITTPRGGGLSFVVASCLASLTYCVYNIDMLAIVPLIGLPLAFIGLIDDMFTVNPSLRYAVQLITAVSVISVSPLLEGCLWFCFVFVVIAFTAVINFINFMDGLDGIVAGNMAVSIATCAFLLKAPLPIWVLVGSLLGFLILNWSPAKVFMGDVGSTFLGFVFASLVLHASDWHQCLALLLVCTPLLGDALICICRRLLAGQSVFKAHRLHLFQRLHQAGWPHARVSSLYLTATTLLAAALVLSGLKLLMILSFVVIVNGIWLDRRVAVSFESASQV